MRDFPLSSEFYYLGAIASSGHRTTLRDLQQEARDGWFTYAIDLHPGCAAHPFRVFVGTVASNFHPHGESDAIEALLEYCQNNPESAIAGFVYTWEVEPEEREQAEEETVVIERQGRLWREGEGAIVGVGQVRDPEAIATCPGGRYERAVLKAYPEMGYKLTHDDGSEEFYVWGWAPGTGTSPVKHPTTDVGVNSPTLKALQAWKLAYEALGLGKKAVA